MTFSEKLIKICTIAINAAYTITFIAILCTMVCLVTTMHMFAKRADERYATREEIAELRSDVNSNNALFNRIVDKVAKGVIDGKKN